MSAELVVVLATAPDSDVADRLASALVEERIVACVNIVPGIRSVYRWQGAVQKDDEVLMLFKTTREGEPALRTRLAELHPYDVPEILAFTPDEGHPAYLQWLLGAVTEAQADQG